MTEITYLGYVGGVRIWLDSQGDGWQPPALLIDSTHQGEQLAALLSPDLPVAATYGDSPVLRVAYTPALDRLIIELINVLGSARYAMPGLMQMSMFEVGDAAH